VSLASFREDTSPKSQIAAKWYGLRYMGIWGRLFEGPQTLRFLRITVPVIFALATLATPTIASAITSGEAQEAAEGQLASAYGSAWLERAPSWSVPECVELLSPGELSCMTEFEHGGIWHSANVGVDESGVATIVGTQGEWAREWGPDSNRCDKDLVVVGYLSSNGPGCEALLLAQNFGFPHGSTKLVRYTGFKKHLYFYGTGTGAWPDFFGYTCRTRQGFYECFNKFGDGFRWRTSPVRTHHHGKASGSARRSKALLWSALGGRVTCGPTHPYPDQPEQLLCMATSIPPPKHPPPYGDPAVFLKARGRPERGLISQGGLWEKEYVTGTNLPATRLRAGTRWKRPELAVTCAIKKRSVRCKNGADHGFVIRGGSYRGF
jgi:hypothetical protein